QRTLTPRGWHGPDPGLLLKGAALAVILAVLVLLLGRRRLSKVRSDLGKQLTAYRRRPRPLMNALGTSLILTLCNVLCLYFCLKALGLQLPLASVMLVFTFGLGAGSIVPTPGGLGAFEAGLTAGLVAYGIDPAPALAAALLYRLISYWLPLLVGAGAFIACQRRNLFGV
ncbi:MAG: lysylphosphatidylglycerol synthase transmembrane domain-containing protein, partial [Candidatus Saccharimonadales bacterium]